MILGHPFVEARQGAGQARREQHFTLALALRREFLAPDGLASCAELGIDEAVTS